ncbi:protease PrsW family protein [Leptospira yanagawae serovar Saopaulo str. Sao Paulo = ATCC 700523]|uniref:Protease PrsW family protein n=1 Tax=Leptospira yanagawae serovar Saopaulo str. Sao Paulo = ATCC 700523 TaxID=1249483 RepID=A0A5E8HC92_9LEPT|nr:PrsW family glutamic-type intramembrane protease [Leptospira yanagawae]EOQ88393.1 protease PrsW family protein [Leptospira yanagawae serovar Saopaulo str. Sao Paulo = ATCC 700523]
MSIQISIPSLVIFLINICTLAFYYSFYRFHFYRFTEGFLQYTALAFSLFSAGFAIAIQALFLHFLPNVGVLWNSFFLSSFVEEFAKLLGIYLFFSKNQDEFTVTDGIFYGLVLGGGFGLVENILYFINTGLWSQVLRSITALPIHMMNGGLVGAFTMMFLFHKNPVFKWGNLITGFFVCVFIHGLYNLSLFQEIDLLVILPICILTLFFMLELTIAKSRILVPGQILKLMDMSMEEYEILSRHNRHEGWIQNVQKHISTSGIRLFQYPNLRHTILTIFFLIPGILSIYLLYESPEWISRKFPDLILQDYFALFVMYPIVLSLMFFFVGILNPYFFRDRMLAVPLFSSVDMHVGEKEENSAIFHITANMFYLPTSQNFPKNTEAIFDLWIGLNCFSGLPGKILWSRENEEGNCGVMCQLESIPFLFLLQWNFLRFKQNLKNLFLRKVQV